LALKQHTDHRVRFDQQVENSRDYVLPFIEQTHAINESTRVFEMGCGEGGVLLPFAERGCYCLGVDLNQERIDLANEFLAKEVSEGKIDFMYKNVYDADFYKKYKGFFDIIILKDVVEHLPQQEKFIPYLAEFLREGGQIFFGFPPWYMPFGGHQQLCKSKLGMMPWYHILPKSIYKGMLKMFGEKENIVKELMEVYDTRISIERFEKIIHNSGLAVKKKQHYLFNPIYKYKFGVNARKQWGPVTHIPFFRNFVTTCVYYTVG
jgi:2-polyprenyl-3-methyl-5-hydroxy-6-metoxy-1,4-benzoquinol methylase